MTHDISNAVGMAIPDEHVGAFVAEVFEDVERATSWEDVVDAMISPGSRDAWDALSPHEQAIEVLKHAARYDEQAIHALTDVPTDGSADRATVESQISEARRCRRNADIFRDGIAAAYADDYLDDAALVAAIESEGFDTTRIANREQALERVASAYDIEFRPYGGTLIQTDDEDKQTPETDPW